MSRNSYPADYNHQHHHSRRSSREGRPDHHQPHPHPVNPIPLAIQGSHQSSVVSFSNPDTQELLYRPESELLCELHVYKVPADLWRGNLNNILNNVVTETVSIGIIRVPPELRLCDIRPEIVEQLQDEIQLPPDYVFLRSVGRSLTRLRGKQERQLKAKHFLPPVAFAPELYILEATPELRDALAISERSSQSPPLSRRTSPSNTHRAYPNSYRNGYQGDSDSDRSHKTPHHHHHHHPPSSPPVNKYQALPHIDPTTQQNREPPQHNRYNPYSAPNDPYNSNSKPNQEPYADRGRPYSNKENDPYNKQAKTPPPPQEFYQQPESQKAGQPESKVVTEAYHSAAPGRGEQGRRSPLQPSQNHPHSAEKGRDRRHDDDSGVAGFTPDDEYGRKNRDDYDSILRKGRDMQQRLESERFDLDDETEEERRRRLEDLESRNNLDRSRWDSDEAKDSKSKFQDEPSTPDLQERDTESARQRRSEEKMKLLQEIEEARKFRQNQEKEREELVRRAKTMQHKTTNRRNEARDMWKKKYFEEKKRTAPMEENRNRLEQELDSLHRKLMNALEGPKEKNLKLTHSNPSNKNNYVIQCTKLQHDIEDIQRRVENAKMKLTAEMKLRNQAQGELRALRAELAQKKTSLTATRQQQMSELSPYHALAQQQSQAATRSAHGF